MTYSNSATTRTRPDDSSNLRTSALPAGTSRVSNSPAAAALPVQARSEAGRPRHRQQPRQGMRPVPAWPQDRWPVPGPDSSDSRAENGNAARAAVPQGRRQNARRRDADRAWLRNAMIALAVLAVAAAVVSWDAQYVMVLRARHAPVIAALEAGIPDTGALIFAALGIALALHGRHALRPRALNLACVAISLAMNALAAGNGPRDVAIWIMPAAVYALASDTLIGVVRARAIARKHAKGEVLAGEDTTPLAIAGGVLLWLLRLALAPASTLSGFRRWVIEECPVAPGRTAVTARPAPAIPLPAGAAPPPAVPHRRRPDGRPGKQDLLIALAGQRYELRQLPLNQVARIAGQIGAEVTLHQGTARRVLMAHVKAVQNGSSAPAPPAARP